jgi:hypothetical protein
VIGSYTNELVDTQRAFLEGVGRLLWSDLANPSPPSSSVCFNYEEVARQDSVNLGSKELKTRSARSVEADRVSKNPADGGGANLDPELLQLALDPDVTPAGILPGPPDNQSNGLLGDCHTGRLIPDAADGYKL